MANFNKIFPNCGGLSLLQTVIMGLQNFPSSGFNNPIQKAIDMLRAQNLEIERLTSIKDSPPIDAAIRFSPFERARIVFALRDAIHRTEDLLTQNPNNPSPVLTREKAELSELLLKVSKGE